MGGVRPKAKKKRSRVRIDTLLVERGMAESRHRAQAMVMAGAVSVDGTRIDKSGRGVDPECVVTLKETCQYVSRGGLKLEGALDAFGIEVGGLVVMDVGASTGGFTDCLLKRGAHRVYAIDVGKGLLHYRLRQDERVRLLESRNIRYLERPEVEEGRSVDMAVVDVSFISLEKVLPRVREFLKDGAAVLALIKPQFEAGRGEVGKGGIVRDPAMHRAVVSRMGEFAAAAGFEVEGVTESPIKGAKGNREFWMYLKTVF